MKTRVLLPLLAALAALAAAPTAGAADRLAVVTLDGGNATVYAGTPSGLPARTVVRHADRAVLSPDARLLAYTRRISSTVEVRFRRLPHASDRLVARVAPSDIALAFSPDGRRLAYSSSSGIAIAAVAGSSRRAVPLPAEWRGSRYSHVEFTPDGSQLVVSRTSGDARAGTLRNELSLITLTQRGWSTLLRSPNSADERPRPVSFHPRGGLVAVDGTGAILVAYTGGGPTSPLVERPAAAIDFGPIFAPGGGWIAFARAPRAGVADVWVVRLDGTKLRRVTTTPLPARGTPRVGTRPLAWSPDARRLLVFRQDRLAVVEVATGKLTTLRRTGVRHALSSARWHGAAPGPAGTGTIVFAREGEGTGSDLYTVRADGTGLRRLTTNHRSFHPAWSPDGRRIAFSGGHHIQRQLFTMNADGTDVRQLTRLGSPLWVTSLSWFRDVPSAPRILFGFGGDLWSIGDDGSTMTPVLQTAAEETNGSLSPTGVLAFERSGAVWLRDDAGARRLTGGVVPQWSPDGSRLLIVQHHGLRGGSIGVVDADGTGAQFFAWGSSPSWSPDGTSIVYSGQDGLSVVRADGIGEPRRLTRTARLTIDLTPSWAP